jgi:hypothetical protein
VSPVLALRELQAAFADAVRGARADPALAALLRPDEGRIDVHRNTARGTTTEALRLSFPAVALLIGEDAFAIVAARFWRARPPREAWLANWGGAFPTFLARQRPLRGLRYLSDVARFEWALGMAAIANDAAPLELASLAAVPPEQHAALRFVAHPSARLLRLHHPGDAIADAVLSDDDDALAALDVDADPVHLLIHRGPHGVATRRLAPDEFRVTRQLLAGRPLGRVLSEARGVNAAALLAALFTAGAIAAATVEDASP